MIPVVLKPRTVKGSLLVGGLRQVVFRLPHWRIGADDMGDVEGLHRGCPVAGCVRPKPVTGQWHGGGVAAAVAGVCNSS